MYPRTIYEMSEEDLKEILEACKPLPMLKIGEYSTPSPQEKVNAAWQRLGEKMGFDYMTVRPVEWKGRRFFSAVPSENETQKAERLEREAAGRRLAEIKQLEETIATAEKRLKELVGTSGPNWLQEGE